MRAGLMLTLLVGLTMSAQPQKAHAQAVDTLSADSTAVAPAAPAVPTHPRPRAAAPT